MLPIEDSKEAFEHLSPVVSQHRFGDCPRFRSGLIRAHHFQANAFQHVLHFLFAALHACKEGIHHKICSGNILRRVDIRDDVVVDKHPRVFVHDFYDLCKELPADFCTVVVAHAAKVVGSSSCSELLSGPMILTSAS